MAETRNESLDRDLILRGVTQNNLKDVDLDIPLGKSVIITGPSGSGKSSLAFDTIYAEGQRRYMQSLSTYARQFLEKFKAPLVESIKNVPPTISLEQVNPVRNSRATVGTSTELYDYLRLLFEKIGVEYCGKCQVKMERSSFEKIFETLVKHYSGKAIVIGYSRLVPKRASSAIEYLKDLLQSGYSRLLFEGDVYSVQEEVGNRKFLGKEILIVLDRLKIEKQLSEDTKTRLVEGVRTAWEMGEGKAETWVEAQKRKFKKAIDFYEGIRCPKCQAVATPKSSIYFSFNSPLGACEKCKGFGNTLDLDEALVVPKANLAIAQGAIDPFTKPSLVHWQKRLLTFCKRAKIDTMLPYRELKAADKKKIFQGDKKFPGVNGVFEELEQEKYKMRIRVFLSRYHSPSTCKQCGGRRLKDESLQVRVGDFNIAEIADLTVSEGKHYFKELRLEERERKISEDILNQLERRLDYLETVGLGYITLSRLTKTLSGGEYQRILLATQLSQGLCDTLYVLDEPSIGLHPKDTNQLLKVLNRLLRLGNSLVLVEHDPELIEWGDYVVDLGPGSGNQGGQVVFSGPRNRFLNSGGKTATAIKSWKHYCQTADPKGPDLDSEAWIELKGACGNNLNNVDVRIPLGCLVSVTGVSGSGKSTLVVDTLYQALSKIFSGQSGKIHRFESISGFEHLRAVELVDQSPIGRSSRSNPITFIKGYDEIRHLFSQTREAMSHGYPPGYFSFNVTGGRCDQCEGEGRVKIDMVFMEDVYVPCEACNERRFKPQILSIRYRGKNIDDVLRMTIDEGRQFFREIPSLKEKLSLLQEVGLGYLQLGQPGYTLSGGEAQRIKIARELIAHGKRLQRPKTLFIFDEPTTGLHFNEIDRLLKVFRTLISYGHSVLVIEHNLQVICSSNYIIDLGPGGGSGGGNVVGVGTPKELADKKLPHTGWYLSQILG